MKSEIEPRGPGGVGVDLPPATSSRPALISPAAAAGLGAAAVVVGIVLPRATPAALALAMAAFLATANRRPMPADFARAPVAILTALGLCAWALVSLLWAVDKGEAASKPLLLALLTGAVWLSAIAVAATDALQLRRIARAACVAFACSLAYLAFEEATSHLLTRTLLEVVPALRPSAKHMAGGDGEDPLQVYSYITNRNMAMMVLLLWPCFYLVGKLTSGVRRNSARALLLGVAAVTTVLSAHETSAIAVAVSLVVVGLAIRLPRFALGLVATGWIAANVLVVPAALVAFHQGQLHYAKWMPNSARHRIVLWAYTAEQVAKQPLHGIGAGSTKAVNARLGSKVDPVPGTIYEWRPAPHAHNVYLQTWYELGGIGAAILLALGLAILSQIRGLSPAVAPFALGTFSASAVIGSFSWGMWQPWFLAAFALTAVFVVIAAREAESEGSGGGT